VTSDRLASRDARRVTNIGHGPNAFSALVFSAAVTVVTRFLLQMRKNKRNEEERVKEEKQRV
jgi:hypothetical protein